jgi:hypothetical protein
MVLHVLSLERINWIIMPRAKKKIVLSQPIKEGLKAIKVQLDHRTVITLASLKALEFWKKRYPQAQVIG